MKYALLILSLLTISCGRQTIVKVTDDNPPKETPAPSPTIIEPIIFTVQFCKTLSTSQASYPEVGLCINKRLYAVYWDNNNSWLTEVIAGTYYSTSTFLPCTFVVKANCEIVNE